MDEVRFNWNAFPSTRLQESNMGHISCAFTPRISAVRIPQKHVKAFKCINISCQTILNKYCQIDQSKGKWKCSTCLTENFFSTTLDQLVLKTLITNESVEFVHDLQHSSNNTSNMFFKEKSKILMYMIDLLTEPSEFISLQQAILESISSLPFNSIVIILTFSGDNITIYDTRSGKPIPKYFSQESSLDISTLREEIFTDSNPLRINSLLYNLNDPDQLTRLQSFLSNLKCSEIQKPKGERYVRVTGKACEFAMQLIKILKLELSPLLTQSLHFLVNFMLFISGPCTAGPGKVVNTSLTSNFRSHNVTFESFSELNQLDYAVQFYNDLIYKNHEFLRKRNEKFKFNCQISLKFDIFSASLDETGLFEMQNLCNLTSGKLVLCDSFATNIFKQNFFKIIPSFQKQYNHGGRLEVVTNQNLLINGAIGPLISSKNQSNFASDLKIGEGMTNSWVVNCFSDTTFMIMFQQDELNRKSRISKTNYTIQFRLSYYNESGFFQKIVTVEKQNGSTPFEIVKGFDQHAYIALLAKKVVFDNLFNLKYDDLNEDLDTMVKNLIVEFGRVVIDENDLSTRNQNFDEFVNENNLIKLNSKFAKIPEFFYHLKKSYIVRKFNITPDETSFYDNILLQTNVENSNTIVEPILYYVSLADYKDVLSAPVDLECIPEDKITLKTASLDSKFLQTATTTVAIFNNLFHILIHYGNSLAYYRDLFIKDINPDLSDKEILSVDIEEDVKIPLSKYKRSLKDSKSLDPTLHILDTVDFIKIFQILKFAKSQAFSIIANPKIPILPRYVETDENKSQARFLYSNLSPPDKYSSYGFSDAIFPTEEVSLNDYYAKTCQNADISIKRREKV